MADNLNVPAGAVPPKPAEASKVQPKKETVRISLPPKPTAKETVRLELPPKPQAKETVRLELPPKPSSGVKMPSSAPSINLVVPQIGHAEQSVQIPTAGAEIMTIATPAAAPGKSAAPPARPAGAPAVAPAGMKPLAKAAEEAAAAVSPSVAGKQVAVPAAAPGKKAGAPGAKEAAAPGKTSTLDVILAVMSFATAVAALIRLFLLL